MPGLIITVAQQKGGSGKTTVAAHLAMAFALSGKTVGLLDVDPQGSLGEWFERRYLLDEVPVFAAAGAVIAGQRDAQRLDAPCYPHPVITAYPGGDGDGELYEDDGVSPDYLRGDSVTVRLRQRGFNQSLLLAEQVLPEFPRVALDSSLIRVRPTRAQSRLKPKERAENVRGAFAVTGDTVKKKTVLLVDDVVTTRETVTECARVLRRAGAARVDVLAFALAVPRTRW